MKHMRALAVSLVFLCAAGLTFAQEWTRFRGPNGTGIGKAEGLPATFTEQDFAWRVQLPGRGHSSPVLWGERIFLTCAKGKEGVRYVVCIDARDGKQLWQWEDRFERYRQNALNSYAASTPAVDAKRVYVAWVSGKTFIVQALDHDGKPVWKRELGEYQARHGAGASPIVLGDMVIVGKDQRGKGSALFALDSATGETRWRVERRSAGASYITPTLLMREGRPGEVVFVSVAHGFTGVDPMTGQVKWETGALFKQKSVASPAIAGDVIFCSAGRGGKGTESAAIRVRGGKAAKVYELKQDLPYVPTPIVVAGLMYVWSDHGAVTCVEPATGKIVYRQAVGGKFFSSPVCVGDHLYGISRKGEVVAVKAGREFEILGRSRLPEGTEATPAIANNAMYIRTFNQLMCLRGKRGL